MIPWFPSPFVLPCLFLRLVVVGVVLVGTTRWAEGPECNLGNRAPGRKRQSEAMLRCFNEGAFGSGAGAVAP